MPLGPCKTTQNVYAAIVGRCYLRRICTEMPEESPLVRQWVLLRTLCARRCGVAGSHGIHEVLKAEKKAYPK